MKRLYNDTEAKKVQWCKIDGMIRKFLSGLNSF